MVILAVVAFLSQNPAMTGDRSMVSKCEVSEDPAFGYTKERPIKVGGTPMFGPARQRKYLQALVGPAGQAITFKRRGSLEPSADGVILDLYEVTYAGVERPIELYLDLYRWEPPKAPRGFLCGAEIGLEPPPPGPLEARRALAEAALARSSEELPPIPLEPDSARRGMAFDAFRLVVLAAREAARAGIPLTAAAASAIETPALLVVVNRIECGVATAAAESITFIDSRKRVISPQGPLITGDALQRMAPGVALPPDAAGAAFAAPFPVNGSISIKYEGTACGAKRPVLLPVKAGPPTKIVDVRPPWPSGMPIPPLDKPVLVRIRATIQADGVPANLQVRSGPEAFSRSALETVRQWRYRPMTINGAPWFVPITMDVTVTFSGSVGESKRADPARAASGRRKGA